MKREIWLYGEPMIEEMLNDPIVRLVMRRDGIGESDVRAAIAPVRDRLRQPPAAMTEAAGLPMTLRSMTR